MTSTLVIKTTSGSVYHVDVAKKTCVRQSGGSHYSGRAVDAPTMYHTISFVVGQPMAILWGYGRDKYSPDSAPDDATNQRWTYTSDVTSVEPLVDCMAG